MLAAELITLPMADDGLLPPPPAPPPLPPTFALLVEADVEMELGVELGLLAALALTAADMVAFETLAMGLFVCECC